MSLFDHCVIEPHDALLLDRLSREDVMNLRLSAETLGRIRDAEQTTTHLMVGLSKALLGRGGSEAVDLLVSAVVDLPRSFAERYLQQGQRPPQNRREHLSAAVLAVIGPDAVARPADASSSGGNEQLIAPS